MLPKFDKTFLKDGTEVGSVAPLVSLKDLKNKNYRTINGFVQQDLVPADMEVEPFVSSLGDYSWRNKVGNVLRARLTGENFLPLPGEYQSMGVPRGGLQPTATSIVPVETAMGVRDENTVLGHDVQELFNATVPLDSGGRSITFNPSASRGHLNPQDSKGMHRGQWK
jgi:hypothetical protein